MPQVATEDLWKKWMGALQSTVLPGGLGVGQQFSAASILLNVDLADADPTISNYYISSIGDVIPAPSPSYGPAGGLVNAYATFLDWIDLGGDPNPNLNSQINIAAGALGPSQTNYNAQQSAAITQFGIFKTATGYTGTFTDWANQNYPTYQSAYNDLVAKTAAYNQLMIQKYGAGYSVLQAARDKVGLLNGARSITLANAFNMPVKLGTVAPAGSGPQVLPGQSPSPPPASLISTFLPSYTLQAFTQRFQEWQGNSARGTVGATIEVGSSSQSYDYAKSGWSTSISGAGWLGEFFRIFGSGSASGETVSIDTTATNFKLKVDFAGLNSFPVAPGPWWDNGSLIKDFPKLKPGAPAFFSDAGGLARLPYQAVVGFCPTINLTMSASDYSNVKSKWQAQATVSIGIGPFRIGSASFSSYGEKQNVRYNDASATITVGPVQSTLPMLLGVISQRLAQS